LEFIIVDLYNNAMAKRTGQKDKTLHRKLKVEQQEDN